MKITNNELFDLVHGSIHKGVKDDGYNIFYRCNQEQIDHLKKVDTFLYDRALFQASVTIEFDTNASSFSFDYKTFTMCTILQHLSPLILDSIIYKIG